MTLLLDSRQYAMLKEMGITVWSPKPISKVARKQAVPSEQNDDVQALQPKQAFTRGNAAHPQIEVQTESVQTPATAQTKPEIIKLSIDSKPLPEGIEQMDWQSLEEAVSNCEACKLCHSRKKTVFGTGDKSADFMFIGEAPGEQEDLQGEPFVGAAGKLLDNMLKAMRPSESGKSLSRGQGVYIANTLKCRPPSNRNPEPAEMQACSQYLQRQIALVKPKVIVALGRFAAQSLLGSHEALGKLRGTTHQFYNIPVVVTYHPAYLLRSPSDKGKAWADQCLAMQEAADALKM